MRSNFIHRYTILSTLLLFVPALVLSKPSTGKAIYVLGNSQENAVIALQIADDGTLSSGTSTPTGGNGGNGRNSTGGINFPDALFSQSALTVVDNYVFAVNPGSNSLSMLEISSSNPTKLTLVGSPVNITGEFPTTVTASSKHKLVCVGSTGAKAGVSCSEYSSSGLGTMDALRPFDLNQTTPPVGPPGTVSQVFFSSDESRLYTTVKGNPAKNQATYLSVFDVDTTDWMWRTFSSVSRKEITTSPPGTAVLFGSFDIPSTNDIFFTDPSFGAGILSVDLQTNKASPVSFNNVTNQKATCWSTYSSFRNSAFLGDAGVDRLVELSVTNATVLSETSLNTGDNGLFDLVSAGEFLYALFAGNGTTNPAISVVSFENDQVRLIQHFEFNQFGGSKNSVGLAILD